MAETTFRLAHNGDRAEITGFMRRHWDTRHPLVELPDFFDYYYKAENGRLRFALAEQGGKTAALAGYIPASLGEKPDVWLSLWVADPARRGSGLELVVEIPRLTGCRTLACNNIRPKTMPLYNFLGFTTGRTGHFYRLARRDGCRIARVAAPCIPPVRGDAALVLIESPEALMAGGFVPPAAANPYKDMWYITRRYFGFPRQSYSLYAAVLPGDTAPRGLLAVRSARALGSAALRIADYIGDTALLPRLGPAIDRLMAQAGAEYADMYCAGLPAGLLREAGFTERTADSPDIIPSYLDPPVLENVEYYYFTNRPEGFTLFKADGDQDRPNIEV